MTEWDEKAMARLRAAVHREDWAAALDVLRDRSLEPVLQYAGDVALMVVAHGPAQDTWFADDCRALLAERGLPGDAELAAELAAALTAPQGRGRRTALLPLPVDLGAVAAAMDGGLHVLDLERGDVLAADEMPHDDEGEAAERWLPIPPGALPQGEDARRGAARKWLADQGYRPAQRTL